ncbi:hypothetical protein BUE80_DR006664 [Diplocarpon rosae]|nr:hypothetical protein BUE80_DR006664 [Diplocarpon rosae]
MSSPGQDAVDPGPENAETLQSDRSSSLPGIPPSSGPPKAESAYITSKWTIGWQTPTLMMASYALALSLAVFHLSVFQYLDGKAADGPDQIAPQGYVTTASNILANSFGFALRALALVRNGVSAIDGSFTQIGTTSTGSSALNSAAAGGCLGGDESTPQELKDLEIMYGEFVGRGEPGRIKHAGFGTIEEVKVLEKGAKYGMARWV